MIHVADNFLQDFEVVREMVTQATFSDFEFLGSKYSGFAQVTLPLRALIEDAVGFNVDFFMSHLRIGKRSTPLTNTIHADNYGAQYAMVLHFNKPACKTGTAFWRHRETGLYRMQQDENLFKFLDGEVKDESKWEMINLVEAEENRAVFFDSAQFHSRWPHTLPIEENETPRLVSTIFFNRAAT